MEMKNGKKFSGAYGGKMDMMDKKMGGKMMDKKMMKSKMMMKKKK